MNGISFWGFVPARGGSKSIPLKNLVQIAGRPLLDYGILAAKAWGGLDQIYCSTDNDEIAARAQYLGVSIDHRSEDLAGDETPVAEVARDFLKRQALLNGALPDWLFLIQPTSPLVLPEHFDDLKRIVEINPTANSAQTVTMVPHNHHAWNQRLITNGSVAFLYAVERQRAYNKQKKPALYVFANLVVTRVSSLLSGEDFFSQPSLSVIINRPYDLDVDGPDDLLLAEYLILNHYKKFF